jgi:hypothetical protein
MKYLITSYIELLNNIYNDSGECGKFTMICFFPIWICMGILYCLFDPFVMIINCLSCYFEPEKKPGIIFHPIDQANIRSVVGADVVLDIKVIKEQENIKNALK